MVRDSQIDFLSGKVGINAQYNYNPSKIRNDMGAAHTGSIGFDVDLSLVKGKTQFLDVSIPFTNKNMTVDYNIGIGANATAKVEAKKESIKFEGGTGLGLTNKVSIGFENPDFRTKQKSDFDF